MSDSNKNVFQLEAALTIREVESVKDKLLEHLQNETNLMIDAQFLEQIDGAGLQLIVSAITQVKEDGGEISWQSVSDELKDAVSTLGLVQIIEFPDAA